jgi:hypothetical protein
MIENQCGGEMRDNYVVENQSKNRLNGTQEMNDYRTSQKSSLTTMLSNDCNQPENNINYYALE